MDHRGLTYNGPTQIVVLPEKTSFNEDFYIKKVLPIVKREGIKLIGEDFIYQQDGAKCHTSKLSVKTIEKMGIDLIRPEIWPPNSPDLSPLDYFFWNEVEVNLKSKQYETKAEMIKQIRKAIKEIPLEKIKISIDNFTTRCRAVEKYKVGLMINKHA